MAFKPIHFSDCTSFVSTYDNALDRDRIIDEQLEKHPEIRNNSNWNDEERKRRAWAKFEIEYCEKWARRHDEALELLRCKDGHSFTKFIIGCIRPEDMNRINDETRESMAHRGRWDEQRWRAFLHATRNIENWPSVVKKRTIGEIEYIDPAWASEQFVRGLRKVALEVGSAILGWNDLTQEEVENLL